MQKYQDAVDIDGVITSGQTTLAIQRGFLEQPSQLYYCEDLWWDVYEEGDRIYLLIDGFRYSARLVVDREQVSSLLRDSRFSTIMAHFRVTGVRKPLAEISVEGETMDESVPLLDLNSRELLIEGELVDVVRL